MKRKPIRIESGAIMPVKRSLWGAADEKLQEARDGLRLMEDAKHRVAFEAGWTKCVDSLEQFWTRFYDEGKQVFSSFQPWAGAIDAERKSESLLQYLYQARHQSQHGRIAMHWEKEHLKIAPGFSGHIKRVQGFPDGTFYLDAEPSHHSVPEAEVVASPGKALLATIENRKFKQRFDPPTKFRGNELSDATPVGVARAGIEYYADVLMKARAKFDGKQNAA
jgi:hypothetical protein